MPLYRCQVIVPYFTNLPTDVIVNQFHFNSIFATEEEARVEISERLAAFYSQVYTSTAANRVNYVDWPLIALKIFNLADPPPRVPMMGNSFGLVAGTAASSTPTEVAAVLSFHAAPESGVRFQRLYNRIYLGALNSGTDLSASAVDAFPRLSSALVLRVRVAATALADANDLNLQWVQVSNAGGVRVVREISGGWVDDGPDTQRRRSVLSATRGTWAPNP